MNRRSRSVEGPVPEPPAARARVERVLIFRSGSIGDTVVALPALHVVARAFPRAERRLLTSVPSASAAVDPMRLLDGTDLVHGAIRYRGRIAGWKSVTGLRREIARWCPDVLVYLAEPRGALATWRDAAFFRMCGVRDIVGLPSSGALERNRPLTGGIHEHEARRLLRCLEPLGTAALDDRAVWDLALSAREHRRARSALGEGRVFLACHVGAKLEVKDWGEACWRAVLARVRACWPSLGIVFVGGGEDRARTARLAEALGGGVLDLCGELSPRESAAVLSRATAYVGHDSGPMHLAAAAGVPCVAVFSARSLPGVWFPFGNGHRALYRRIDCQGCGLERCVERRKACIVSITVDEVFDALAAVLDAGAVTGESLRSTGR